MSIVKLTYRLPMPEREQPREKLGLEQSKPQKNIIYQCRRVIGEICNMIRKKKKSSNTIRKEPLRQVHPRPGAYEQVCD